MDILQQYSNENLGLFLQKINENNDKVLDILQILISSAETDQKNQNNIIKNLKEIRAATDEINDKIDNVLNKLTGLESSFIDIKSDNRDIEQKLIMMTLKLSNIEKFTESEELEDLEDFYALSQSLYSKWEELDELTRRFIPIAEYLYSKLQKYDKADFSPVVLELCRAIENEFLLKIFRKYTFDVISRKSNNLDKFLALDRANDFKTNQFIKSISNAIRTKKPEYTLGQMKTILINMKNAKIVRKSPLLLDFEMYLKKNTEMKKILDSAYLDNLTEIVDNYRNPSAHPEFMTIEKAIECRKIMPERIDYLIDCLST